MADTRAVGFQVVDNRGDYPAVDILVVLSLVDAPHQVDGFQEAALFRVDGFPVDDPCQGAGSREVFPFQVDDFPGGVLCQVVGSREVFPFRVGGFPVVVRCLVVGFQVVVRCRADFRFQVG